MRIAYLIISVSGVLLGACSDQESKTQPSLPPEPPSRAPSQSARLSFDAIGLLSVSFETDCDEAHGCCGIPEGCGPRFKLEDQNLQAYTPLIGHIKEQDWDRLIGVRGELVELPETEYGVIDPAIYTGSRQAIMVESYEVLGRIRYHEFLVESAGDYVKEEYPCLAVEETDGRIFTKGNKEFGWRMEGDRPVLVVRMVETNRPPGEQPYLELSFDADTGAFLSERRYPKSYHPCD